MTKSIVAFVGLGSNLQGPAQQIEHAFSALAELPQTRLAARSSLYATAPWGGIAQPDYVNAVARLDTELDAPLLLAQLLAIEQRFGRCRGAERYGPRVIDLDLLLYADQRIDLPGLHVPHPRLHERAFALVPLAEIAPTLEVPGQGNVNQLLAQVDATACRIIAAR